MAQRIAIIVLVALIVLPLSSQQPAVPHNQAGRPGYFRFITLEQGEKEAADIQRVNESLMRLGGHIATVSDDRTRQQMLGELTAIAGFVRTVEERRKPAGITAAEVEQQLNAAKGEAHCGTCHGARMRKAEEAQSRLP
jgi:mono/diheme cytochrome c family protein